MTTPAEPNDIVVGARVVLREGTVAAARQHLRTHCMHGDVGTVLPPSSAGYPGWIIVRFDGCPTTHRLSADELSVV